MFKLKTFDDLLGTAPYLLNDDFVNFRNQFLENQRFYILDIFIDPYFP